MKINPRLIFYILVANLLLLMFARQIEAPVFFIIIILLNFFITVSYPVLLVFGMLKLNKYLTLAVSLLLTSILFYILITVNQSLNTALFILFLLNIISISTAFINRLKNSSTEEPKEESIKDVSI